MEFPLAVLIVANNCPAMSRNALNSSAFPLGSVRNIVACSPAWPRNRTYGSMTKATPARLSLAASASQSGISSTMPKCGTGTSWPSTGLCAAPSRAAPATAWQTSW